MLALADVHIGLGSSKLGWDRFTGTEDVQVRCGFGGVDVLLPPETGTAEERGGFFKKKHLTPVMGTSLKASLGFGGLDVLNWGEL